MSLCVKCGKPKLYAGNDSESDYDSDYDLNEDEEKALQQKLIYNINKNNKKNEKDIKDNPLKYKELTIDILSGVEQKFNTEVIKKYVDIGSELNERLRKGKTTNDDFLYIKKLNNALIPINDLFENIDYIKTFRCSSVSYDHDKTQGFLSTSNRIIPGFGSNCFLIIIPQDVKIGIIDISKKVSIDNTFEIILPNDTLLQNIKENKYIVKSEYYNKNEHKFNNIIK